VQQALLKVPALQRHERLAAAELQVSRLQAYQLLLLARAAVF
jgi:hypothetical protein